MSTPDVISTQNMIGSLLTRQGGGLFLEREPLLDVDYQTWLTAARVPEGFKPFTMSIYNKNQDVSLILMINPKDFNTGQTFITSNAYTRVGWVTSAWGRQQMTISLSGTSPGFYVINSEGSGGLSNFNRRGSAGFYNLMAIVGMFKNNGYYFLNNNHATIFKDGYSRVINVMDSIKLEYEGSTYLGSFSTFSMTDTAAMPYRIEYTLEFIVSSIGADLEPIEGHISDGNNNKNNDVTLAVQGDNAHINDKFTLSEEELKSYYSVKDLKYDLSASQSYLRGGGQKGVHKTTNAYSLPKYNTDDFLSKNPKVAAAVIQSAAMMLLTPEQLASIITLESAGTWSPIVDNANSDALGIGQFTHYATETIAPELVRLGYIKNVSECQTSEQLTSLFNTTGNQVALFPLYAKTTMVKGKSLLQRMQEAPTSDERFNIYMIGHFFPKYVGLDLDTAFPQDVQDANPGIRTPRDYINNVKNQMRNINSANWNKVAIDEPKSDGFKFYEYK